ncbi:MAG: sugar ABC transporter substrate-binding protein [Deinococcales bacterium]
MIHRRSALRLLAPLFVAALVFALSSALAQGAGPDGYPAYTGQPVTITMWGWTSNEDAAIATFEKAYPTIKVKWENVGAGNTEYQKVLAATSAGTGLPDVIMSEYTYAPQFMEYGSFQAMNKWVPQETYLKYYPEVTLKWTAMDGKIYGTPQDSGAMTMVYRKDIFDKYGLTVPKTWDDFRAQAEKLHEQAPDITFCSMPSNFVLFTMGIVWQAGSTFFDYANGKWYIDFTNDTAKKVMNYWGGLVKDNLVRADMWWNADWYKELQDGKAATVINGGWFPEWLQLNAAANTGLWRVATLPQWDPANPINGEMGGSGFYVSSQSKNPEAASLFVLWLNSQKDALVQLHDKSQLPVLWSTVFKTDVAPTLVNTPYEYFGGQMITQVSVEALDQVKTAFTALPVMSQVSSSNNTQMTNTLDGKQNWDQFLASWQNDVVAFMRQQGFNNLVVGQLPPGGM